MTGNQLSPGDEIRDIWSLPVGVVVEHRSREITGYRDHTAFLLSNGYPTAPNQMPEYGAWHLISWPDVVVEDNLARFQQRAKAVIIGRSYMHLGEAYDTRRALERMDDPLPNFDPSLGMWIDFNRRTRDLPVGAIAAVGNPNRWDQYALHRYDGHDWFHVTGGRQNVSIGGILVEAEGIGQAEWTINDPAPGDAEQILNIKRQLWEVGQWAREQYSWCSTADYVMGLAGAHGRLPETLEEAA